jgi:hypothetical protein
MTTMPIRQEAEVKEAFGVDPEVAVAGLVALGRPLVRPTRLRRRAVEAFATVDRFDGPPLTA